MALTLVRHTQPDVAAGVCYGQTDLALAPSFVSEREKVVQTLHETGKSYGVIYASPLTRCRLLASHLEEMLGAPLVLDNRLVEMNFGRWETRFWSEIPRAEIDQWSDDFLDARPHGGECVRAFSARTLEALDEIEAHAPNAVVVTHAGVIRAALARRDGTGGWRADINFGDVVQL